MIYPRAVTEVSYRFHDHKEAHIYLAFEVNNGKAEIQQVVSTINQDPTCSAIDITENDMVVFSYN